MSALGMFSCELNHVIYDNLHADAGGRHRCCARLCGAAVTNSSTNSKLLNMPRAAMVKES